VEYKLTRIGNGKIELLLEEKLPHSPEKVWHAFTKQDLMQQWFPCDVEGDWAMGEPLQFSFPEGQHEGLTDEEMRGEVLIADEPLRLEFTWGKYKYLCQLSELIDESEVECADGIGCQLQFTESFADSSEAARNAAGWEMCFENLDAVLNGTAVATFAMEVWQPKFEKYVQEFEPELGKQQGAPENH